MSTIIVNALKCLEISLKYFVDIINGVISEKETH